MLNIWVDADALPKVLKSILYRAAERLQLPAIFVANKPTGVKPSPYVSFLLVKPGLDVADEEIVRRVQPGDLVITADIPLAVTVVDKDATALSPHGDLMTRDNVRERLSIRNFLQELRGAGINTGGPAAFSDKDRENFANELNKFLTRHT
jgi:uncharacterized protein YaiI (UPF0178 family)